MLVTSGVFTFDYDGRFYYVGPGAVMLQSAIVHRQLFYTWSGLSTEENLKTPQTVVPDPMSMGYSGKFLEAFITDPTTFPNPTIVGPDQINEDETPRVAWSSFRGGCSGLPWPVAGGVERRRQRLDRQELA